MHVPEGHFWGFRRPDGQAGVRNHVLIMPTIVCANQVGAYAAAMVTGAVNVTHPYGCGQIGRDWKQTFETFVGFGSNANAYGVVVLGLGCEGNSARAVAQEISRRTGKPVELVLIQDEGGTLMASAAAARAAALMVQDASGVQRELIPMSELIMATECGGSDFASGLSANPALGAASDQLVADGGTVLLAETTELIGAEPILRQRATDGWVRLQVDETIAAYERRILAEGVDIRGAQPSPGNMEGGLTTIEEKSLGAAHKAGTTPLKEIIPYGARPTQRGLIWMDTPGQDIEQLTGMVAGGAQIICFTTGRGTPTGSPIAPVIKIASNTAMFRNMRDNMDINAGTILDEEETVQEVGWRIYREIQLVASGRLTRSEVLRQWDFGIHRIGPTI